MSFNPRPYQLRAIEAMAAPCPKGRLVVMCVGSGKTLTALSRCVQVLDAGGRVVWLAHRQELLAQPHNELRSHWFHHGLRSGIVQADRDAVDAQCVFASIDTLARPKRIDALLAHGRPTLVVVDEAHHEPAAKYRRVLDALAPAGSDVQLVGLTATPDREDGKPLEGRWEIVFQYDILDAIRDGWLVDPYVRRYRMPELEAEVGPDGRLDMDDDVAAAQLLRAHVVEHTVAALNATAPALRLPWRDHTETFTGRGRQWLVFTATIEQAQLTAAALCKAGWRARAVSGQTPKVERDLVVREYRHGRIDVLCNADLFTEGTDLPSTGGVVFARAARSRPLFVQILGRAMRLADPQWNKAWGLVNRLDPRYRGKQTCLAIDLTGCTDEHSIVAAGVLFGDSCTHVWREAKDGKAVCKKCEVVRPCWASIQAGGEGQHAFPPPGGDERPACKHCGREQCPSSPEGRHVWKVRPGHKRGCVYCPAEYTDPLACMVRRRDGVPQADERFVAGDETLKGSDVALVQVAKAPREAWAVDLDVHGLLLLQGERVGPGAWDVRWHPPTSAPKVIGVAYDTRRAWATAQDMIRQTAKRRLDTELKREVYGGFASGVDRQALLERARAVLS